MASFHITAVRTPEDLAATISLFTSYVAWLDLDLSFQGLDAEMASMPGKYAPPTGELFLARDTASGEAIGCIGLRPLPGLGDGEICETKRLYVAPEGRGRGVAKALAIEVLRTAETLGYNDMRLDTLPRMAAARALYESVGFKVVPRYYETPLEGTIFMGRKIGRAKSRAN